MEINTSTPAQSNASGIPMWGLIMIVTIGLVSLGLNGLLLYKAQLANLVAEELTASKVANEQALKNFESKVSQYLAYKKEGCDDNTEGCLDTILNRLATTPASFGAMCVVRDSATSMPAVSSPDTGKGYAKMTKPGAFTIEEFQKACTKEDYDKLLQIYCEKNSNTVQLGVAATNEFGGVETTGCGQFGCGYVGCPAGSR